MKCPVCDSDTDFTYIAQHWRQSCEFPEISKEQNKVINGLFMGDGSLATYPDNCNAVFEVNNTNTQFLEHVYDVLYPISNKVRQRMSAEEAISEAVKSNVVDVSDDSIYRAKYRYRTVSHPGLNRLSEWIVDGDKRFPCELPFSSTTVKYWYVCDGGVCWNKDSKSSRIQISSTNEMSRLDEYVELFSSEGIELRNDGDRIMGTSSSSVDFLDWIGDPVPGFEYKWEIDDLDRYESLYHKAYYSDEDNIAYGSDHTPVDTEC